MHAHPLQFFLDFLPEGVGVATLLFLSRLGWGETAVFKFFLSVTLSTLLPLVLTLLSLFAWASVTSASTNVINLNNCSLSSVSILLKSNDFLSLLASVIGLQAWAPNAGRAQLGRLMSEGYMTGTASLFPLWSFIVLSLSLSFPSVFKPWNTPPFKPGNSSYYWDTCGEDDVSVQWRQGKSAKCPPFYW